jgi:ankyrin repeat protein
MKRKALLVGSVLLSALASIALAADARTNPNSEVRSEDGWTPLMRAAAFGTTAELKSLLQKGADPNAKNAQGATALLYAIPEESKVRALLEKGANVNVQTKQGRTPLHMAAAIDGGVNTVRLLLDKGADVNARAPKDPGPIPTPMGNGATALLEAARQPNPATLKLLLERGAKVDLADDHAITPLMQAAILGNTENVRLLLDAGADVNAMNQFHLTPLLHSLIRGNNEVSKLLIDKGADVNVRDFVDGTGLMWAAFSERGNPEMVSLLLAKGVDPTVKNKLGETALDIARKRGNVDVLDLLAKPNQDIRAAVTKGLNITIGNGLTFIQKSGCQSCHNNNLPLRAAALAREKGIVVQSDVVEKQTRVLAGMWRGARELLLQGSDATPDIPMTGSYLLDSMAAAKIPADATTDAMVRAIAIRQSADGRWLSWAPRPPLESGDIHGTAISIRALSAYAPAALRDEYAKKVTRAAEWLRTANPASPDDRIWQLQGLAWAKAEGVEAFRKAVLADQRPDGGWAQLPGVETDAYATGRALMALYDSGVAVTDQAFERGIRYLLRTQESDGSWHIKSRSFPFQPLNDTGFPHGRDQWISAAGTSWAVMALTVAIPGA